MNNEFNEKIQLLKTKVNIVDIIGHYLKLNKRGNNYWAVCPFHEDSHPSMSVSQEKQIYKCFSCGEQGNVFIFLQKFKKIDFIAAVKLSAEIVKLDLSTFDLNLLSKKMTKSHPNFLLNQLALTFFQYQLTTEAALAAKTYLESRQINDSLINQFHLGYAPNDDQLLTYLESQNQSRIAIINSGLIKINNHDKIVNLFTDRIIIPIFDIEGNCLGFSGRNYVPNQDNGFKYVNTPETEIFKKRAILYNLFSAKQTISNQNDVLYLVEGYMDVIALSKLKINNCVALMGTNLTQEHILLLQKVTKNIIIFLDGDDAGKTAACKIATKLLEHFFNVEIIANQTNSDPDELVHHHPEQLNSMLTNPIHPLDFMINFLLTKNDITKNSKSLKQFLLDLQPMWAAISDSITLKFYYNKLKNLTKLSDKELESNFNEVKSVSTSNNPVKKQLTKLTIIEKLIELQKQLLTFVLLNRQVYEWLENEKFIFNSKPLMTLYYLLGQEYLENPQLNKIDLAKILIKLKDNEFLEYLQTIVNKYYDENYQINESLVHHYLQINNNYLIEVEIENLKNQIPLVDQFEQKIKLLKQMSILKNKISKQR